MVRVAVLITHRIISSMTSQQVNLNVECLHFILSLGRIANYSAIEFTVNQLHKLAES